MALKSCLDKFLCGIHFTLYLAQDNKYYCDCGHILSDSELTEIFLNFDRNLTPLFTDSRKKILNKTVKGYKNIIPNELKGNNG